MTRARGGAAPVAPPAALDLHSAALNLARQAADRRRTRSEPLTRRAALAEAPWIEALRASGCSEREWRTAYADRLIERGLALPSSTGLSGPSGASGKSLGVQLPVKVRAQKLEAYRSAASTSGLTLADWVRQQLDRGLVCKC